MVDDSRSTAAESYRPPVSSTTAAREHRGMAASPRTSFHSRGDRETGSLGSLGRKTKYTAPNRSGRSKMAASFPQRATAKQSNT